MRFDQIIRTKGHPAHKRKGTTVTSFIKDLLERAVKSAAQAALLVIGADQVDVLALDWANVAGFAAGAAVLSALTSVASANFGRPGTASLVAAD